ncbi:MAG: membrane protein insertase YidC [Parvularculaceae bacterium]|nr:membrane protein insertase YidC [Parvularculaceae bacterium]
MDRNTILFIVLTAAVLIGWDLLVIAPQREALREQQRVEQAARDAAGPTVAGDIAGAAAEKSLSIEEALAKSPGRVKIETPSLTGSINLAGGRIDDLLLKNYRETLDERSPMIRLLTPSEAAHGHYIEQGFVAASGNTTQLTESLTWSATAGAKLTPETPVTLTARIGALAFEKTYSVDKVFMFTVKQVVRNEGVEPARVTPYGLVVQRNIPDGAGKFQILHEGPLAVVDKQLLERKYKNAVKKTDEAAGIGGWVGITNKYWLAAAAPPQNEPFTATLKNVGTATAPIFRANYTLAERTIAPGQTMELTSHLFGGAKDVDILRDYEQSPENGGLGIKDLDKGVDWGNFFFLTRPIFWLLDFFGDHVHNWGVAILLLTLVVKALMFPLANKAFESMSAMKKVQPKLEELKTKFGDDKMKLQQEMMELYKREKINPLAGCLPILIQMPIFYALYKTLFVTIELRHQPFFGWIKDLSAPDPTSVFNLFGLLPYEPTAVPLIGAFLGIGVLPLLMGVAMWFQTKLNPPATDPIQQQVLAMMPIIFVFLFASFSAGLVLYWVWSTVLSILQQWLIMKRNGVAVDWGARLPFLKGKKPALEKK